MYSVIHQSKLTGIEVKCVTMQLQDARKMAKHYLKLEMDFELAKGFDVEMTDINDNAIAEYCLTYGNGHKGDMNSSVYTIVNMPPIISSTNIDDTDFMV